MTEEQQARAVEDALSGTMLCECCQHYVDKAYRADPKGYFVVKCDSCWSKGFLPDTNPFSGSSNISVVYPDGKRHVIWSL